MLSVCLGAWSLFPLRLVIVQTLVTASFRHFQCQNGHFTRAGYSDSQTTTAAFKTKQTVWHNIPCLDFAHRVKFLKTRSFGSRLRFRLQIKKRLTWWTPYNKLFSIAGHYRNCKLRTDIVTGLLVHQVRCFSTWRRKHSRLPKRSVFKKIFYIMNAIIHNNPHDCVWNNYLNSREANKHLHALVWLVDALPVSMGAASFLKSWR